MRAHRLAPALTVADPLAVRDLTELTPSVPAIGYQPRRRNTASVTYIPARRCRAATGECARRFRRSGLL